MNRTLKHGSAAATVVGVVGILGAGCLSRPVNHDAPSINTNFTAVVHNQSVDKVDLLFMIDNSASMGDKQNLLAAAVPDMITRLIQPNCVDAMGNIVGQSDSGGLGTCTMGTVEFPPVHDMHIGIVTSSLGGRGGDQCPDDATNPANAALNAHNDDHGELMNRGGVAGMPTVENTPVADEGMYNFLSWFPNVPANMGKAAPPTPALTTSTTLIGDFTTMVEGVHEHGCGFEAQNESWYRFLIQPDPYSQIVVTSNKAAFQGIDATILLQRANFLRPDSLVTIIVVTDENEAAADPLTIGGQGWAFNNSSFPGSPNGASPEGTIECSQQSASSPLTTGPNDPKCTSCAFIGGASNFSTECPQDGMNGTNGYLDPTDDALNNRYFAQKYRFGITNMYPTYRYIRAMTRTTVPDSGHEHDGSGNYVAPGVVHDSQGDTYVAADADSQANCVNPLFAQNLPTDPTMETCALGRGPRTPDLVYYAAISGVPHQLLQAAPGAADGICASGTAAADCPQKDTLAASDWLAITGNDPEHYDFSGADFHMVESEQPRTTQGANGSPTQWANVSMCAPTAANNCDPWNGREWNTNKEDLQFACIFDLRPQYGGTGKDCTNAQYNKACDCQAGAINAGSQLCDTTTPTLQIFGKAYPSIREMLIAHAMSTQQTNQGIVSSLCPIHVTDMMGGSDPLYGYRPAVNAIVNRLKNSLNNQCVPQQLTPDPTNNNEVPCLILAQLSTYVGPGSCENPGAACNQAQGLVGPGVILPGDTQPTLTQDILNKFCQGQTATYVQGGGKAGDMNDPDNRPTCALQQLTAAKNPNDFDATGSCAISNAPDNGWCYVTGAAAGSCGHSILFTPTEPPSGATVSLQCIEQAVGVLPDAGAD